MYGVRAKNNGYMIKCPFHDDDTPSCSISLGNSKVPPGYFYCFGCGTKGAWNVLAEKIGAKKFKNGEEKSNKGNKF